MEYYHKQTDDPDELKRRINVLTRDNVELKKKLQMHGSGVDHDEEVKKWSSQFEEITTKIVEFGKKNVKQNDDQNSRILEIFYTLEMSIDSFVRDCGTKLTKELNFLGTIEKTMKFKNFITYYFVLHKKQVMKQFLSKLDQLSRSHHQNFTILLQDTNTLHIAFQLYLLGLRFDPSDRLREGEDYDSKVHRLFTGKYKKISHVLSPSYLDFFRNELKPERIMKSLVCCEKIRKTISMMDDEEEEEEYNEEELKRISMSGVSEVSDSLDPNKVMERVGGMNFGGSGRNARVGKAKKKSHIDVSMLRKMDNRATSMVIGSSYNTRLQREIDMRKEVSAAQIKQEELKKKEAKLRRKEEELKRREEALKLFEEEMKSRRRISVLQIEQIKKKVGKKTEEARKEYEKVAKKRQKRLKEQKKKEAEAKKKRAAEKKKRRAGRAKGGRPTAIKTKALQKMVIPKIEITDTIEEEDIEKSKEDLLAQLDVQMEDDGVGELKSPYDFTSCVQEFLQVDSQFDDVNKRHFSVALEPDNKPKNRYMDVLPYNHNVIVMKGNYINASECNINNVPYIACQWPLKKSRQNGDYDFWSMCWYYKVRVVVNLQPPKPPKHHYYWPPRKNVMKLKKYTIQGVDIEKGPIFDIYKVHLSKKLIRAKLMGTLRGGLKGAKDKIRTIDIMVYKKWPDHGIPEEFTSLWQLMQKADRENKKGIVDGKEPPMVVHCSAGIGRSGVFMLAHNILRNKWDTKKIPDVLYKMRKERHGMVQTPAQYKYAYDFIWKYTEKKTDVRVL